MVLKVEFDKKVEQRFRELAMRRYGYAKGALKKASEEAITMWIKQENRQLPKVRNPFKLIEGIMGNLQGKYNSVELQHEATKIWSKGK